MGEPHEPSPKKRSFLGRHRDLLAAVVSGFVGAVALATSTYNVYLQRQQVKAQVWPYLVLSVGSDDGISLTLRNRGVGAAQLKRVRVLVDGKPVEDWVEMISTLLRKEHPSSVPEINHVEDEVMPAGLELTMLKISDIEEARLLEVQADRVKIDVCYCSTLDDCWLLTAPGGTQPISSCPPDPKPFLSISEASKEWMMAQHRTGSMANDAACADATAPAPPPGK